MTEQTKSGGLQLGAILTLVPLVSAAFGGLQYYRDQQQREFEAVTFYLQNQATFDPCTDAQLASLNLGMIENTYPRVYTKIEQHVGERANQCDSVEVVAQQQQQAANAAAPATEESATQAPAGTATRSLTLPPALRAPGGATPDAAAQQQAQLPTIQIDPGAYFRNRYDRMANLPVSRARQIQEGVYRIYIQISAEESRPNAAAIQESLRKAGHNAPGIEQVPIKVEAPQLRYYRETQAADAQRLADEIEHTLAAAGTTVEVTPTYVGEGRNLPAGTMELWLP
ncbi:MAG: hypothetical protein FD124_722 [Alphaproteobacteria bacterium]|nr:MAG: hypothetical protein FD160_918 [Caulobacteraceae bacterium]TPW07985.1 MAG: hypothetical protein FD124_722 [Alphaproteobacteria bacterium]